MRGQRLSMDVPFGSWGTLTLIAGLSRDVLIAPWVIKDAMNGPTFVAHVREVLEIEPGTVFFLDTLAIHKNKERHWPCTRTDAGYFSCRPTRPT